MLPALFCPACRLSRSVGHNWLSNGLICPSSGYPLLERGVADLPFGLLWAMLDYSTAGMRRGVAVLAGQGSRNTSPEEISRQ